MTWYRDPTWVARFPLAASLLLELANFQQLWRMWSEGSALGQSIGAWISVQAALWLYLHFYRVLTPDQRWAILAVRISIGINWLVIGTVCWFRFVQS